MSSSASATASWMARGRVGWRCRGMAASRSAGRRGPTSSGRWQGRRGHDVVSHRPPLGVDSLPSVRLGNALADQRQLPAQVVASCKCQPCHPCAGLHVCAASPASRMRPWRKRRAPPGVAVKAVGCVVSSKRASGRYSQGGQRVGHQVRLWRKAADTPASGAPAKAVSITADPDRRSLPSNESGVSR